MTVVDIRAHAEPGTRGGDDTDVFACPQCARPSVVEWRHDTASTSGPVRHVKISCALRHWFVLPVGMLEPYVG